MPNPFPTLHTERLDLIQIRTDHLADIFKLFGDSKVTQFYNLKTLTSEEEGRKIIDLFHNRFTYKTGVRWGIALKGQSNIIGTIGFNSFTRNHKANVGYDLQSAHWNNGYLTEALKAIVAFGFSELEIDRIEAEVMRGNRASERVLTKVGFKNEGMLRHWLYWDEKYYDMTMFSLLKEDYKPNNEIEK